MIKWLVEVSTNGGTMKKVSILSEVPTVDRHAQNSLTMQVTEHDHLTFKL